MCDDVAREFGRVREGRACEVHEVRVLQGAGRFVRERLIGGADGR